MASFFNTFKGWLRRLKGGRRETPTITPLVQAPRPPVPERRRRGGNDGEGQSGRQRAPRTDHPRHPRPEQPKRQKSEQPRPPQEDRAQHPPRPERQPRPPRSEEERLARPTQRRAPRSQPRREPPSAPPLEIPEIPAGPAWDPSEYQVPPEEGKTRFHDLDIPAEIMHAIAELGFQYCTPVQAEILPKALKGLDATGRAQTGTGKTAAFLISILAHILRNPPEEQRKAGTPRALILAPTRELVIQIEKDSKDLSRYCRGVRTLGIYGGMDYNKQRRELEQGTVDIIVATPGRLLDFKSKGGLMLSKVEIMVIDEADRMLDMGFIPDVRRIIESTPPKTRRHTMLFSATLTPDVVRLASKWTKDAFTVEIDPGQVATDSVDQKVYIVTAEEKFKVLYNMVVKQNLERVMVFCNRRDDSQHLAERFAALGIVTGLLSGDVSQDRRIKTLEAFRGGTIRVMVATDVAARGLHIEDVSHVMNYNMPLSPDDYVHRIGRTGRAGATGISVSFADEMDAQQIPAIEEYMGRSLPCIYPDETLLGEPVAVQDKPAPLFIEKAPQHGGNRRGGPRRPGPRRGRPGPQRGTGRPGDRQAPPEKPPDGGAQSG